MRARSSVSEQGQTSTWTLSHRGIAPCRRHCHTSPDRWHTTSKLLDSDEHLLGLFQPVPSQRVFPLLSRLQLALSAAAGRYGSHNSRNAPRKPSTPIITWPRFLYPLMLATISMFLPVKAAAVRLADPKPPSHLIAVLYGDHLGVEAAQPGGITIGVGRCAISYHEDFSPLGQHFLA